jgi:hypothetical protein
MSETGGALAHTPLAARMRPRRIEEFIGQEHILGPDTPLGRAVRSGSLHSMILWVRPAGQDLAGAHARRDHGCAFPGDIRRSWWRQRHPVLR